MQFKWLEDWLALAATRSFKNAAEQRQTLDIFDARDLGAGPVAQVLIPRHIPTGFHGCWFAASRLKPRTAV